MASEKGEDEEEICGQVSRSLSRQNCREALVPSLHSTAVLLLVSSVRAENCEVLFWGKNKVNTQCPIAAFKGAGQ